VIAYFSIHAASILEADNDSNDNLQQLRSESRYRSNNISSSSLDAPLAGNLQIPYSGLVTMSITPAIAERLDLDTAITRGQIVTYVIPGSPGEKTGIKAANMTRTTNTDEMIESSGEGDIIFTVDGSASFATDYDSIEQYIYENKKVGDNITLSVLQDGQIKDREMTIEALPAFLWYENEEEGFKIKYPPDWTVSSNEQSTVRNEIVKFLSMERAGLRKTPVANISVLRYLSNNSDAVNTSEKDRDSGVRILNTTITTLDNSHAYNTIFYDYSQEQSVLKVLTVFSVKDVQLYRIDYSADTRRYDDYFPLATEMIKSFHLIR
jgi:hypothetical protein